MPKASTIELIPAQSADQIATVRSLFQEYADWLDYDLCLQSFDEELATLPGKYAPPSGRLYIAKIDDQVAGCVALRKLAEGVGELKRLYLRDQFRGRGAGRAMTQRIIDDAQAIGYSTLRLDTLLVMKEAMALYHSLGFKDIPPPGGKSLAGEIYMELTLVP